MNYEFTPDEIADFEAAMPQVEINPKQPNSEIKRLEAPTDAALPVLFQAEQYDSQAYNDSTDLNWETFNFGLDWMDDQVVEMYRQRAKVAAAKGRNEYFKTVVEEGLKGPGKPQDSQQVQ